jgi:ribonuclease I
MAVTYFDTLEAATKLKESGFTEQQAAALATLQKQAIDSAIGQAQHDYHLDDVATKRDLKELETGLKHDIELLRAETKRDIAESKAELIRWVVGVGLLQTSLIIGALMKAAHLI